MIVDVSELPLWKLRQAGLSAQNRALSMTLRDKEEEVSEYPEEKKNKERGEPWNTAWALLWFG